MLVINNFGSRRFAGWVKATAPGHADWTARRCPAHDRATGIGREDVIVVNGRRFGQGRDVWVKVDMQPYERIAVDLSTAKTNEAIDEQRLLDAAVPSNSQGLVSDPVAHFAPSINQVPLATVSLSQNGPAVRGHFRARTTALVVSDLWVEWVPGEPWARFVVAHNAANPANGAVREIFPNGFDLRIGDALVAYLGGKVGALLIGDGEAQGQQRKFAGTACWRQFANAAQEASALQLMYGYPQGVDQDWKTIIGGLGVPEVGAAFQAQQFVVSKLQQCIDALYRWPAPPLGVAPNSGQTGTQEEQAFCAEGEEIFIDHPYAEGGALARYAVALGYGKRPCHWREVDGSVLKPDLHPNCGMWGGRPHFDPTVSPDRLGLERIPADWDTNGWIGPDREHWFYGSLWLSVALKNCPALQQELEHQANLVLLGERLEPGGMLSGPDAARAMGWFGILAVALHRLLEDKDLAERVRQRAIDRIERVYIPICGRAENQRIWNAVRDDRESQFLERSYINITLADGTQIPSSPTLPQGAISYTPVYQWPMTWMPYQQAVGAFGVQVMGEAFDHEGARQLAYDAALRVVEDAWTDDAQGRLVEWEILGLRGDRAQLPADQMEEGKGAHRTGWFSQAWLPMAAWVVLRHDPNHPRAKHIYDTLRAEALQGSGVLDWMPPVDRPIAPRLDAQQPVQRPIAAAVQ